MVLSVYLRAAFCSLLAASPPTVVGTSNDGTGRVDNQKYKFCEMWGWGSNQYRELLFDGKKPYYTTPVKMETGRLDPNIIKSIQGGATASSFGMAVTCTCTPPVQSRLHDLPHCGPARAVLRVVVHACMCICTVHRCARTCGGARGSQPCTPTRT